MKRIMKAIVVENFGGPEALVYRDAEKPAPKAGEALVKLEAVGLNYIDVYHRTGLYPLPRPFIPGMEAAGVVEAIGPDVTEVTVGDRVAYAMQPGAYAEYAVAPAWKLVKVPEGLSAEQAAAAMLQGMTAHYLTTSVYPLKAGEAALIHAAAGGVGLLLIQMVKRIGALAIGTVSTEAKAQLGRRSGAARAKRLALFNATESGAIRRDQRRTALARGRPVQLDQIGRVEAEDRKDIPTPRRRRSAPATRRP